VPAIIGHHGVRVTEHWHPDDIAVLTRQQVDRVVLNDLTPFSN